MNVTKKMAAVLATATLALGLTACGDGSETETVSETAPATTVTTDKDANTTARDNDKDDDKDDASESSAAAASSDESPSITIDGKQVSGTFTPVHCTLDTDGGQQELNIDAGDKSDNAERDELEVEITDPEGTPRLTGLSVERANDKEFELTDAQENAATVTKDGSTWTITGEGHYDDDESTAIPFDVKVSCPA